MEFGRSELGRMEFGHDLRGTYGIMYSKEIC